MKPLITNIPLEELPNTVGNLGLKKYAADQIIKWLYQKRVSSFEEMTNLSKDARAILSEKFEIDALEIVDTLEAADGTKKFLCRARDGECIECVIIPANDDRWTVCVSTQVGCRMGCAFCRTAEMGFRRDLTMGEIVGQLLLVMRDVSSTLPLCKGEMEGVDLPSPSLPYKGRGNVTNVVLMGMGEPLANVEAVSDAINVICDGRAIGLSKLRVTLSTAGLLPELRAFSEKFDIKIAISLNATTDEVRSRIMPINKKYPIAEIMKFCREYSKRSRHRITFEYVMIGGVNDTKDDAKRLIELLKGFRAKINLIPFNPYDGCDLAAPDGATVQWWSEFLYGKGIQTNTRISRGQEIMAACGQLATIAR